MPQSATWCSGLVPKNASVLAFQSKMMACLDVHVNHGGPTLSACSGTASPKVMFNLSRSKSETKGIDKKNLIPSPSKKRVKEAALCSSKIKFDIHFP